MNKKTIIQVVIIVGAFGASGFVLYNGMFKQSSAPPPPDLASILGGVAPLTTTVPPTGGAPQGVVVSGDLRTRLEVLDKNGLTYGFLYPTVDKDREVGVPVQELVKSLNSGTATTTP